MGNPGAKRGPTLADGVDVGYSEIPQDVQIDEDLLPGGKAQWDRRASDDGADRNFRISEAAVRGENARTKE